MMLLAELTTSDLMMVLGVTLITAVLMLNLRKKFRKKTSPYGEDAEQLTSREKIERIKQQHGMKDDLRSMMVELEDLTRRFGAQLDARAIKVEKLLRDADERIRQLEELTGRQATRRQQLIAEPRGDDLTDKVSRLADQGKQAAEIAAALEEHIGKIELILALRQQEKAAKR